MFAALLRVCGISDLCELFAGLQSAKLELCDRLRSALLYIQLIDLLTLLEPMPVLSHQQHHLHVLPCGLLSVRNPVRIGVSSGHICKQFE